MKGFDFCGILGCVVPLVADVFAVIINKKGLIYQYIQIVRF